VLIIMLVKITVLVAVAYGVVIALRRASAGARHLVWLATLVGLVLLPIVARSRVLRVPVLPASITVAPSAPTAAPATERVETTPPAATAPASAPVATAAAPAATRVTVSTIQLIAALWALGVVVLLVRLAHGLITVRRIARTGDEITSGAWMVALHEVADRMDIEEPARLVMSSAVRVPFACGFRQPTIVLPADAMSWTDERRRIVLLHELAHIQRRDMFGHLLSRVACAMYWFHPFVWLAAQRLRAESERACDDLAIRSGARASDYAQHLLDIVTSIRTPVAPAVACTMARRRDFEGRMLAILDPERRRGAPSRVRATVLVTGLGGLYAAIAVAVLAPREASPQPTLRMVVAATPVPAPQRTALAATPRPRPANPVAIDTSVRRSALLIEILRTDSSASLRKVAAWGLEQFGDEEGVAEALSYALGHDADASVREMSAWALEAADGEQGVSALASAVRGDKSAQVRETSAWALGSKCDHGASSALVSAMHDSSAAVRENAAWAFGSCGDDHAPAELTALLTDRESRVRRVAVWALYEIKDPSSETALTKALDTETDTELRRDLVRAVASIGDRAPEAVEKLLESKDRETRELAVHALAGDHLNVWPMPMPRPRPSP
jgi:beta-lactamase regulating signal transducer with metallopeptidase domain/HEAT repeat protein